MQKKRYPSPCYHKIVVATKPWEVSMQKLWLPSNYNGTIYCLSIADLKKKYKKALATSTITILLLFPSKRIISCNENYSI